MAIKKPRVYIGFPFEPFVTPQSHLESKIRGTITGCCFERVTG